MEQENSNIHVCDECGTAAKEQDRFCHNCGAYLNYQAEEISIFNDSRLQSAFFFFIIYLFICLLVSYSDWFHTYDHLFWVEITLAAITSFFVWRNWSSIKPVLRFNNFNFFLLLAVIAGAVVFSSIVNITINEINVSVFHTQQDLYQMFRIYQAPVLLMIYSLALLPAICEELAFRAVLYNYLSSFLDERLVVMVTAFAFALMHLSFIGLLWLVPFAILLGMLRRKYNTIWYGVIFHFTFNLTACLFDLYRQGII